MEKRRQISEGVDKINKWKIKWSREWSRLPKFFEEKNAGKRQKLVSSDEAGEYRDRAGTRSDGDVADVEFHENIFSDEDATASQGEQNVWHEQEKGQIEEEAGSKCWSVGSLGGRNKAERTEEWFARFFGARWQQCIY